MVVHISCKEELEGSFKQSDIAHQATWQRSSIPLTHQTAWWMYLAGDAPMETALRDPSSVLIAARHSGWENKYQ